MLPIQRDNNSWTRINSQFMKGGFDWDNQDNPDSRRWYYKYYISEGEIKSCQLAVKYYEGKHVSIWLRNVNRFEEIKEKYKCEDWEKEKMEWRKINSMSWRRTKYEQ